MVDIVVRRGSGAFPGDDIEDPLICDVVVAVERGRNAIDKASNHRTVDLESVLSVSARNGKTLAVHDAMQGEVWQGKISGVTHTYSNGESTTRLQVIRPL